MMKVWSILLFCAVGVLGQCPHGWKHHDESCYFLHSHDKYNWVEAAGFCRVHNAHLAYVEDESENAFIKGLIIQNITDASNANVWLGATDEVEEWKFVWYGIEQPVTYTDWGPGEPNSVGLNIVEDCLVMWQRYNYKWADLDCHDQCYFICERNMEEDPLVLVG